MKIKRLFDRYTAALIVCFVMLVRATSAQEKPNILIFYVDDLGWQDVQINDVDDPCPYETPNIISLAEGGMNFTQGYAPANCCSPSRAAIITGQHPAKNGMTNVSLGSPNNGAASNKFSEPYLDKHLNTILRLKLSYLSDLQQNN